MGDAAPGLPGRASLRSHVASSLSAYWSHGAAPVEALPVATVDLATIVPPLRLVEVVLPQWAHAAGVDGVVLVPREAVGHGDPAWEHVDWWAAAFLMMECWHERVWETAHGPAHSSSNRLGDWDTRAWERAWVNRIALFLRQWAAQRTSVEIDSLLGRLPAPDIRVSHDVDAVFKTLAIRLKQSAMGAVASMRRARGAAGHLGSSVPRFLFGSQDWWTVTDVLEMESERGIVGTFNLHADQRRWSPKRWLMDPGYRLDTPHGRRLLHELSEAGAPVGLHPTFDSFDKPHVLHAQREHLETSLGRSVTSARQHWLRFSWHATWAAQEQAGIREDSTLMFNDRPGFRASVAASWHPWNASAGAPHSLVEVPCCFMDSHRYDYADIRGEDGRDQMEAVVHECAAVRGTMQVLWHPHTLSHDYGWRDGFAELLDLVGTA